jgi:GntR family transcriptional regulator
MRDEEGRMAATPRYEQIADDLRRRIESHEFERGSALPTEAELQRHYEASRNTVRDAIKLLVQHHLLEPKPGQGTFVTKAITPFVTTLSTDPKTGLGGGWEGSAYPALIREQGREAGTGHPEVAVLACPPHIAALLRISADDYVVSRHQKRFIDATVWSLQTTYYPMAWVQLGAAKLLNPHDIPEGTVAYLATSINLKQVGYRDLISARLPNDNEQALFGLTHNHTVIEVCRTSFTDEGTPMRVTVTVFPSDRNQIVYDIGIVPDYPTPPAQPWRS